MVTIGYDQRAWPATPTLVRCAAIGAAVFGIPLAYQTGKAGKEEAVKQSHDAGVSDGKKETVGRIDKILPAPSALAAMGGQEGQDTVSRIRAELLDLIKS